MLRKVWQALRVVCGESWQLFLRRYEPIQVHGFRFDHLSDLTKISESHPGAEQSVHHATNMKRPPTAGRMQRRLPFRVKATRQTQTSPAVPETPRA